MATHQWLSRAPVAEARVTLAVAFTEAPSADDRAALHERLSERYPRRARREPDGEVFSGETLYSVEASPEGLSCVRKHPYAGFGPFVGEVLWAWERYLEVARPERLRRLAVRFRNHFDAPLALLAAPDLDALAARHASADGPETRATVSVSADALEIAVERAVDLAPDSHLVWQALGELAKLEHRVFFASVTDEALAPYV
jgi:hypothetical protein